uniref:DDE Tnp4 domain-containing protein n=1 Tax=Arundo donax TaxID=35708 RepID=A0A0A9GSX1_ARUDO
MSHLSDTSSCSDDSEDSNTVDPTGIYTMDEFVAEQSILHNFLERITAKIQAKIEAQEAGTSCRRSGNRRFIGRNHEEGHQRLVADFFSEDPVCDDKIFRTNFRMRRPLFLRIVHALGEWSPYFTNRRDGFYRQGISPLQKCTAAIRMLSRGSPADAIDQYVQIGESTAMECLELFAEGLIDKFGGEYLRGPTSDDMQRLLQIGEDCGFPGMLGTIGCMHWEWENCPPKWMRRLNHKNFGEATITLEAVASHDLRIWHAFFGVVGSDDDINVLNQSPLFTEVLKGQAPQVQFSINKRQYNMGYYLADGIYPEWAVFVKTIPVPKTEKEQLFARYQEEARKDLQLAFNALQSRFPIVRGPTRFFQRSTLGKILQACVILHNMAIEDEKDMASACFDSSEASGTLAVLPSNINNGPADCFANLLQKNATLCAQPMHSQLRRDLIEHIWQQFGPFGDK